MCDLSIILDGGSSVFKIGFGGENQPECIFPHLVGRPIETELEGFEIQRSICVGVKAFVMREALKLSCPLYEGLVFNWRDMEKVWHHAFYSVLKVKPQDYHIIVTEPPINPTAARERVTRIMFEKFEVAGLYLVAKAILCLYALGRTNGVVVKCGHETTQIIPIYGAYVIPHSVVRFCIGGKILTTVLSRLLAERNFNFTKNEEIGIVKEMKENLCYVSQDFKTERKDLTLLEKECELPDGDVITINEERIKCPEVLFNPRLVGIQNLGLHEEMYNMIIQVEDDIRQDLFSNILLCGGTSLFKGFSDRLYTELRLLIPTTIDITIFTPQRREYAAWLGGSVLSMRAMSDLWLTKNEYLLYGPKSIRSKCFVQA